MKRKSSIGNGERNTAGNECSMIRRSRLLCSREEQPQAANARSDPGHWEADTVAGKTGSSCLMTLTCRKSGLLLSLKIPRKTSAHVRDDMIRLLGALPPEPVRSITPDRGKEFANNDGISAALDNDPFSFPPPHAVRTRAPMGSFTNTAPNPPTWNASIPLSSPPLPARCQSADGD